MTDLPLVSESRRDDVAEAKFLAAVGCLNRAALDAADAIEGLAAAGHWRDEGCASVGEYAKIHGLSARLGFGFRRLSDVIQAAPSLREEVAAGKRNFEAVAALHPLLDEEAGLLRPGETLPGLLEDYPTTKQVHWLVRQRRIEKKDEVRRHTATLTFTEQGVEDLDHARAIESQRLQRPVSPDETVETALKEFVKNHDAQNVVPRTRRMADTDGKPGRGTAAEVKRWLLETYGVKCCCRYCDRFLLRHRAHIVAKILLGGQEKWNLIPPCVGHHKLLDAGFLRVETREDGRRYLVNKYGRVMGRVIDPPPEPVPPGGGPSLFESSLPRGEEETGNGSTKD